MAAESAQRGGEFAGNKDVNASAPASSTGTGSASTTTGNSSTSQGSAAPSYVNNQYIRDESGPHGKNIQEGIDYSNTRDGIQAALNAEPGSKDDPSRVAEQEFEKHQVRVAGDAGPKQQHVGDSSVYENLKSDTQA